MALPKSFSDKTYISAESILKVAQGVGVACKARGATVWKVSDMVKSVSGHAAPSRAVRSFDEWYRLLVPNTQTYDRDVVGFLRVTLAVSLLREKSRRDSKTTPQVLNAVWALIRTTLEASHGGTLQFSVNRSAQGFLAVPLCSLIDNGKIEELWRFHVWLPDNERGLEAVAIHAHQPWAQSWILAGRGVNLTYNVELDVDEGVATHATYGLAFTGKDEGTKKSAAYKTHQMSSTITNTHRMAKASLDRQDICMPNMSYIVPSGVFHKSDIPGDEFHATLFVFDASRGFDQDAPVLGPANGHEYTQLRDAKGITPAELSKKTQNVRMQEQ